MVSITKFFIVIGSPRTCLPRNLRRSRGCPITGIPLQLFLIGHFRVILCLCFKTSLRGETLLMKISLRTVPTKYKGFLRQVGPRGKSRSLQGYWNPQGKIGVATHFSR